MRSDVLTGFLKSSFAVVERLEWTESLCLIHPSTHPSTHLSTLPSVHPSIHPSTHTCSHLMGIFVASLPVGSR